MVGSFITRGIIMVLGYIYPAYECFKAVERNRAEIENLRFWCQYWMILAMVTVMERVCDALISWVPMYSEAKLAFIIYLWYPKTRGTTYVYSTFVKPFVAKHELEIDRNLNELRTRAGDWLFFYWIRGSTYFQARFIELLQYVASQSARPQRPQASPQRQAPPPPSRSSSGSGSGKASMPPSAQPPLYPTIAPSAPSMPRQRSMAVEDEDSDYDVLEDEIVRNGPAAPVPPYMTTRSRNRSGTAPRTNGGAW